MDEAPVPVRASPEPSTLACALRRAHDAGLPRLDAQLLLARVTGRSRTALLAHDDDALDTAAAAAFDAACRQALEGVPIAYLTGVREFHGLELRVDRSVLVPRPDTETLVDWALALLSREWPDASAPSVLDLGTGSGAIALAIAHGCRRARVTATDLRPAALGIAWANARALSLEIEALPGSWWQPVAGRRFDLVVANPPYLAESDPHLPALRYEPRDALVAPREGLGALEELAAGAGEYLREGGWLLLEHGWQQGAAVRAMLASGGLEDVVTRDDLAGRPRCSGGRRKRLANAA